MKHWQKQQINLTQIGELDLEDLVLYTWYITLALVDWGQEFDIQKLEGEVCIYSCRRDVPEVFSCKLTCHQLHVVIVHVCVQGELPDGTEVAVRRLSLNSRQGKREFAKGVKNIIELQHRNVVKLIGCCYSNSRLLVYEYIGNGSVASALFGTSLHPYVWQALWIWTAWSWRPNLLIPVAHDSSPFWYPLNLCFSGLLVRHATGGDGLQPVSFLQTACCWPRIHWLEKRL
jgi:hypothetical protein